MFGEQLTKKLSRNFSCLHEIGSAEDQTLEKLLADFPQHNIEAIRSIFSLHKEIVFEFEPYRKRIKNAGDIIPILREEFRFSTKEEVKVVHLDPQNRMLGISSIAQGSQDNVSFSTKDIFWSAVENKASAIIIVHNHPCGDPTPSTDDIAITRKLVEGGKILEIAVYDHIIIARKTEGKSNDAYSIRDSLDIIT